MNLATEADRNNLKTEDVFDENDRQLIEDLTKFIEDYQNSKYMLQEQIEQLAAGINQEEQEGNNAQEGERMEEDAGEN